MRWIREHKLIAGLLAILLALVLIFLLTAGSTSKDGVTGTVNKGMSLVSNPLTAVTRTVRNTVSGLFSYRQLQAEVETLQEEKAALELELAQAALTKSELEELRELSGLLNYDYTNEKFDVVTVDITSFDGSNWTNIFTIDCGTEAGIKEGCVVISGDGLVGKISRAGEGWAQVVSIIDDGTKVSFKVARNRKLLGVVEGNQQGQINGYMLKGDAAVAEGDIIITSGMGTYPAGLEIGTIQSITYNSDTLLKEITVESAVDFRSLTKVAVIL